MAVGIALRGDPRNLTGHAAKGVPYTNQESALKTVPLRFLPAWIQEVLDNSPQQLGLLQKTVEQV